MNIDEIKYLLAAHIIVTDGEINIKEAELLNKLIATSSEILEEYKKIASDEDNKITLDELLSNYSSFHLTNHKPLITFLFKIIYADGYYDDREKDIIRYIANYINYSEDDLVLIEMNFALQNSFREQVSWQESMRIAFYEFLDAINDRNDDEESSLELLSGRKFSKKIRTISQRAKQDLNFADKKMGCYISYLGRQYDEIKLRIDHLRSVKSISKKDEEGQKELNDVLKELNEAFKTDISKSLEDSLKAINKKRRTIDYFTIAFMGRTKAGKSTLHKIVTHEDLDDIGVGKLRTTRFNRCWYWENIRIIDTPGIGAPGGKSDTETAKSIIDEADLICYIVTNDSIQETEFDFLDKLKERNKPIFIILNVKENLDHPIRYKRFIQDPLKWKTDNGDKSIKGHIERIKECIGKKYDANSIEIIPLQLLAAQMADDVSIEGEKTALIKGSNIEEYVRKIKQTIYLTGDIKKTQNIIDGCNYNIFMAEDKFRNKEKQLNELMNRFDNSRQELLQFIQSETKKHRELIKSSVDNCHKRLLNNAKSFADKHFDDKNVKDVWENDVDNQRIFNDLKLEVEDNIESLVSSIQGRIEECLSDLNVVKDFNTKCENITGESITDWKFGAKILSGLAVAAFSIWGTGVAGAALFAATNIWNPIGWGIVAGVAVGLLASAFVGFFTSKETKIKKAKEKLYNSLEKSIKESQNKIEGDILNEYDKVFTEVRRILVNNFEMIINEISQISSKLLIILEKSSLIGKEFNLIFAYRIFNHVGKIRNKNYDEETEQKNAVSVQVYRNFKESTLKINSPYFISEVDRQNLIKILQISNIEFTNNE